MLSHVDIHVHALACVLSRVGLFVTPWTIANQATLLMGFSGQKYWSGLPFLPPEYLPDPEIEPESLISPEFASGFFTTKYLLQCS